MKHSGAPFLGKLNAGLLKAEGPKSLAVSIEKAAKGNLEACQRVEDWQALRQAAHDVKAFVLANLDTLLIQLEAQLVAKGFHVLWAKDAAEANQHVLNISKEHNVRSAVKAKSMLSEELNLNHFLAKHGIEAIETDLGEYIVQLAGQRPTHIVMPALHLSAADIGRLFADKLGEPYTDVHQDLTMIARKHLRDKFLSADLGISGANFAVAETGTLAILENEGNIGLSTSVPKIHVALVGIEKVLPKLEHLPLFLNMLPRMGTGQTLTSYTHFINGPASGRKIYVILVDNGRTKALALPKHRKILHCIRCGYCMNNCPVYRNVGGWAYGWIYPGPLGAVITPLFLGTKKAGQLPFACSLCGACSETCPVKIDLSHQIVRLRQRVIAEKPLIKKPVDQIIWRGYKIVMNCSQRYRLFMSALCLGTKFVPFLPIHPYLLGAWTKGRAVPQPPKDGAFRIWWRNRK